MRTATQPPSRIVRHRANLKRLIREMAKRPFDFLPERSVECVFQFLTGYGIFGAPIWRDLSSFEQWIMERLYYPKDSGARWWRFIQLNSKDNCDSYDLFCRLYSQYCRRAPIDIEPTAPDHVLKHGQFDFYRYLYGIYRKPGLYLGSGERVQSLAAHLAGYFKGKKDARINLTADEKEFFRFDEWLRKRHKFPKRYPWFQVIEMWRSHTLNSLESFFANYDSYLTDFGKKPRGLDDIFESVSKDGCTTIRRRKKRPKNLTLIAGTKLWWRSPYRSKTNK